MTGNNKLFIENKKVYETVYELKDEYKIPSFEEFMKSYEGDETVSKNYQGEFDSYGDIRINKSYGPGNRQSREEAKVGVGVGMAVLTFVCPPAGIAVGGGLLAGGTALAAVGKSANEQELQDFGLSMVKSGADGVVGGLDKYSAHVGKDCSLPICPKKP